MISGLVTYCGASAIVDECRALPKRMRPFTREVRKLQTARERQGKGDATELMRRICFDADDAQRVLVLWPKPFGDIALSQRQLIEWYARSFGFIVIQHSPVAMMARNPGTWPEPKLLPVASAVQHG